MLSMPHISVMNIMFLFPILFFLRIKKVLKKCDTFLTLLTFNIIPYLINQGAGKTNLYEDIGGLMYTGDYYYIH